MTDRKKIQIIDIGLGNIASIQNMLKKRGAESERITSPLTTESIDLLILPGVGSFDYAMRKLNEGGWTGWIRELAEEGSTQLMGICLGMQLLCDGSEEGELAGLSLIPGYFKKFSSEGGEQRLKVPHMGWNRVTYNGKGSWLMDGHKEDPRYYFVHSYHYTHEDEKHVVGITRYGVSYASVIEKNNVIGFQFHPEKSHRFGMNLFQNVLEKRC